MIDATAFRASWVVSDTLAVARRNFIALFRNPRGLLFQAVQPIIFVVMFRYVFGGAVRIPGLRYVDFLMAGIFVQTVTFGSLNTGVGLAEDLQKGIIERFRSLPMARSAVLGGRTIADVFRNTFVVALMFAVGYLVGFRVHTNAGAVALAVVVLLAFGYAMSWVMALIGLTTREPEAAQAAAFPILAVLVFGSNSFVSTATMPGWLRAFADHQPITANVNAVRALVLGGPTASRIVSALAWTAGLVIVFAPLAVWRYRRTG